MPKLKVASKVCTECLFSSNRIVSKTTAEEIIIECEEKDKFFICHKFNDNVCCKGFYDRQLTQIVQLAMRLCYVEFIDPEESNFTYKLAQQMHREREDSEWYDVDKKEQLKYLGMAIEIYYWIHEIGYELKEKH